MQSPHPCHFLHASRPFRVNGTFVFASDGKYGLWLDDIFEKGVSQPCMTFGNEPLSEEGEKFDIIGVELWKIG